MESKKKISTKKLKSLNQTEEDHLASVSTEAKVSGKINRSKENEIVSEKCDSQTQFIQIKNDENNTNQTINQELKSKKKLKQKKQKKNDRENQSISVKSSFTKFDDLQKQNLIHVRSSDGGKAKQKFSNPQYECQSNCRLCLKPVYKMEEIKAEKSIFHQNCFRCIDCNKQLKVDTYYCHERKLYCMVHFKLMFAPKISTDNNQDLPKKHELIIRENQPEELPPDVIRASSKPDLGLEELHQLNVRSRFYLFENGAQSQESQFKGENERVRDSSEKPNSSIFMKLAKLKQNGCLIGDETRIFEKCDFNNSDTEDQESDDISDIDDADIDLVRSRKCTRRERPIGLGDAMSDIKSKFESGNVLTKEERREERKQEIQNIRSRLFMGKQARIKEMYQQAVAESEQGVVSARKKTDFDIGCGASSLKERFEKGTVFEDKNEKNGLADDADVFDSAISKKSRSIFLELDASIAAEKSYAGSATKFKQDKPILPKELSCEKKSKNQLIDVVKCDDKSDDVQIQTSEISEKFKFFETFRPAECTKKHFRITPPREGVVKLPTPESEEDNCEKKNSNMDIILEKSQTTSIMLNKFRQMENKSYKQAFPETPRPLKCFTPPPDQGRRFYSDHESDFDSEEEEEEEDENEIPQDSVSKYYENDEALKEAQLAARAKLLRAKFEKWEANEIQKELNGVEIYLPEECNESCIESTKALRERFENIGNSEKNPPTRSKHQVNRFV